MADNPAKESALNTFQAEEALVNLLDNSKATGNEEQKSEAKEDVKTKPVADDAQELTPDDLDLVSEETDKPTNEELFDVKISGKMQKVTLDELRAGYSKETDYRTKSMKLADDRKSIEDERHKIMDQMNVANQEREKYTNRLQELSSTFKEPVENQAELDRLFQEDPAEYVRRQADITRQREAQAKVQSELAVEKRRKEAEYREKYQQVLQQEQDKLIEKIPAFADPNKRDKLQSDIKKFLTSKGFKNEELQNLSDHRTVMIAHDAMKMDQLRKAKLDGKKVKRVPKIASPGNQQTVEGEDKRAIDSALANMKKNSLRGNTQATKDAFKTWLDAQQ